MARSGSSSVTLVAVDDAVLEDLVGAATTQASADEVTPPLTPGSDWSPARVAWLRAFHRDRRAGLDGPLGEATWAVVVEDRVVGSVRLKRTEDPGVRETGAWLVGDARGRGVGTAALVAVLAQAAGSGARTVRADTTVGNDRALGVLRRLGFSLRRGDEHGVQAVLHLGSRRAPVRQG